MRFPTIVLCAIPLVAAEPVLRHDFAADAQGWLAVGAGSALEAKDAALHFRYDANQKLSLAVLPVGKIAFAEMQSIRFELKTDSPFAVGMLLAEKKPGGNYSAIIWSNGGAWRHVTLTPSDFAPNDGANDPVDPDHKLDLDQVENLGLLDLSQFFAKLGKGDAPFYVEPHEGAHAISMRNFEISRDAPKPEAAGVVDDFSRPQPGWFTFGGVSFEQDGGKLLVRYRQIPDKAIAFARVLPVKDYRGATHLAMDVMSDHPAQFVISLRGRRADGSEGARYNADFYVPASAASEHREIALSAFEPDENGPKDPNGKLDPAAIHSITVLDISGESALMTLTLSALRLR